MAAQYPIIRAASSTMPIDKIFILGPEGTFSDNAARRLNEHLTLTGEPRGAELSYTRNIPEALERAAKDPNSRAVAPIENSEVGTVVATQDNLAKWGLTIEWEINLRIRFNLLADAPLDEVLHLYTHPVAQGQCDLFLSQHLPRVEVTLTRSNIDSGVRWGSAAPAEKAAAIVPWDYVPSRSPSLQIP